MMTLIIVAVLLAGYLLMSTVQVSHINRAAVAMFCGVIVWVLYVLQGGDYLQLMHPDEFAEYLKGHQTFGLTVGGFVAGNVMTRYISEACAVILFIIATNTIVEVMNNNGVFDSLIRWLRMRNSRQFLWSLTLLTLLDFRQCRQPDDGRADDVHHGQNCEQPPTTCHLCLRHLGGCEHGRFFHCDWRHDIAHAVGPASGNSVGIRRRSLFASLRHIVRLQSACVEALVRQCRSPFVYPHVSWRRLRSLPLAKRHYPGAGACGALVYPHIQCGHPFSPIFGRALCVGCDLGRGRAFTLPSQWQLAFCPTRPFEEHRVHRHSNHSLLSRDFTRRRRAERVRRARCSLPLAHAIHPQRLCLWRNNGNPYQRY